MPFTHRTPCSIRSCRSDDSLQHVAEVMCKHDRDYLLIVNTDGYPIGMITAHQLFVAAKQQDKPLAHIRVSSAVRKSGTASTTTQSLAHLEPYSTRPHQRQIPIFDIEDGLVNVVSADWLARCLSTMRSSGSPAVIELSLPRE
jgi:CBS-domain-containing membrane protein